MSLSRLPFRAAGRPPGFTLVEALIALTVLGVALLLGVALVMQVPRDVLRLDAERRAMRVMEATLDGIRTGTVPLSENQPPPPNFITRIIEITRAGSLPAHDMRLQVTIESVVPTTTPHLCQVTLTADYLVLNSRHKKRLLALFRGDC
jgi:prepilin-type N-terminal cleavage/methylation domain-containing protein